MNGRYRSRCVLRYYLDNILNIDFKIRNVAPFARAIIDIAGDPHGKVKFMNQRQRGSTSQFGSCAIFRSVVAICVPVRQIRPDLCPYGQ